MPLTSVSDPVGREAGRGDTVDVFRRGQGMGPLPAVDIPKSDRTQPGGDDPLRLEGAVGYVA